MNDLISSALRTPPSVALQTCICRVGQRREASPASCNMASAQAGWYDAAIEGDDE